MSTKTISDAAVASFRLFIGSTSREDIFQYNAAVEPTTLAEYIRAWMSWGEGPEVCIGDFAIYLTGVIAIIDEWARDPGLLGPSGDAALNVTSIFGEGVSHLDDILDPHYFARVTFQALHPPRES